VHGQEFTVLSVEQEQDAVDEDERVGADLIELVGIKVVIGALEKAFGKESEGFVHVLLELIAKFCCVLAASGERPVEEPRGQGILLEEGVEVGERLVAAIEEGNEVHFIEHVRAVA